MLVNSSRWYQSSYSLTAEIYDFSTFIHCVRTNVCRLHLPTCICEGVHLCEYIGEGVCHLVREGGQKLDEGNDLFFSLGFRLPPFFRGKGAFGSSPSLLQQRITRFHEPIITSSPRSTQFLFVPGISFCSKFKSNFYVYL